MPHMSNDHRGAFEDAVYAYLAWNVGEPEPAVDLMGDMVPISRVCGKLWHCDDILPSSLFTEVSYLETMSAPLGRRTYACAARMLKWRIDRDLAKLAA